MKTSGVVRALVLVALAQTVSGMIGWNNDGSADFPDADPPVTFDGEHGTNLLWKTRLPNWSNSSPIVVKPKGAGAARVFCLAEPVDYAPILLCFDADNGKELWRCELDPIPCVSLDEHTRQKLRADFRRLSHITRECMAITAEGRQLYERDPDAWKGNDDIPEWATTAVKDLQQRANAIGCSFRPCRGRNVNDIGTYLEKAPARRDELANTLRKFGLCVDRWWTSGTWIGQAYPTPVSDGTYVYTVTCHNLYTCHDFDGNILWQRQFPPARPGELKNEERDLLRKPDGTLVEWPKTYLAHPSNAWPGDGHFSTSPIIYDGSNSDGRTILISAAGMFIRALDARTGEELWRRPLVNGIGQSMCVPAIVAVGGVPCIISVDYARADIIRLRDGIALGRLPGTTNSKNSFMGSCCVLGDGTVVTSVTSDEKPRSPDYVGWALSLVPGKDKVTVSERWRIPVNKLKMVRPAWRGTDLFTGEVRVDGTTGEVTRYYSSDEREYFDRDVCLLMKHHSLMCSFRRNYFVSRDLSTGRILGVGHLPAKPSGGVPLMLKRSYEGQDAWRWMGGATPCAYKDRLFIRTYDFMYCFSK
jgi:outer membrane protein assembly factor BamB